MSAANMLPSCDRQDWITTVIHWKFWKIFQGEGHTYSHQITGKISKDIFKEIEKKNVVLFEERTETIPTATVENNKDLDSKNLVDISSDNHKKILV